MSTQPYFEQLMQPISADLPCGKSIEDTQLLSSFDAFRVFGQSTPLDGIDWREMKSKSLEALAVCKDFRLLGYLAAAVLRIENLTSFCVIPLVAAKWLDTFWEPVHPQIDDDAILRKNALNCLSDRMAIIDALRRAPLVTNAQLGSYSLRDVEIATGKFTPTEPESRTPTESEVNAVFLATPVEQLSSLREQVQQAAAALKSADAKMRSEKGIESAPSFDDLVAQLAKIDRIFDEQIAPRLGASGAMGEGDSAEGGGGGARVIGVGSIKSRQDAIKALDAVAAFFRQNEPSSPVPLFIERGKRLVAKNFLEVLADIAPDALEQAKTVGGVKNSE